MVYKNDNVKKIVFIVLLFLLLASPVLAQEINYPQLPGAEAPQDFLRPGAAEPEDIPGLWVKYIINLATWSAGIIAFLSLVLGGIKFLISTGSPDKITDARKQISGALLGLMLILTAYFVLETLSPFFIDFTLPEIRDFSSSNIPSPPLEKTQKSSIDVYVPFGRIIENIFQTYISNVSEAEQSDDGPVVPETLTRIQRITNILDASMPLLPPILERTNNIRDLSRECECWGNTLPDDRCLPSGCGSCFQIFCTSDPCEYSRDEIVETENELLPYLFSKGGEAEGIEGIIQHDAFGEEFEITTNLTTEITRLEEEVKDLKIWFNRLARAQEFVEDCDWLALNNRNQFFQKKDEFEAKDWVIEDVAFYDDADIVFNVPANPTSVRERWYPAPGTALKEAADESTLYCALGGTYVNQPSDFNLGIIQPDPFEGKDDITAEDLENESLYTYEVSCDITIPFGEILDKAHRMTRLLLNQMELILDREKRIVEAAVELQRLVSRCSSRMCFPLCICIPYPYQFCIEVGCFGPACPKGDIGNEARDIEAYVAEIQGAQLIIRRIFNELTMDLLQGMEASLRSHMTKCTFEREKYGDVAFYTCDKVIGGTNESGKTIMQCDAGTNDEWQDTLYGGCLNNCLYSRVSTTPTGSQTDFFEYTDYRKCVSDCMASVCIYNYNHELNFHCCHLKL